MKPLSAYFLVGPTAAGKSAVAHRIAIEHKFTVLSADAMQIYRGMNIGTAKPSAAEQAEVRYEGIDLADPRQSFSVAQYADAALSALHHCDSAGRPCIVAGGTGLYVKALTHGMTNLPQTDPETRARAQAIYAEGGIDELLGRLSELRPDLHDGLPDRQNPRRVLRAMELALLGAQAKPAGWKPQGTGPAIVGLLPERQFLAERIRARVESMYRQGLPDEVRLLMANGLADSPTARHAIGYAEAMAYVSGAATLDDAVARTVSRTMQLAKRQITWFKHQANVQWINIDRETTLDSIVNSVWSLWETQGPTPISMQAKEQGETYYQIRDIPARQRPREQMDLRGPENVSDIVLLAIILAKGIHGLNVIDLAADLLNRYRTLTALASASVEELKDIRGMGPVKAQVLVASLELARRLSSERADEQLLIRTPKDAAALLEEQARPLQQEVFWMLPLDARNRLKRKSAIEISKGLLDASLIHPREVFKPAIVCSSAAIVLVHNHPSGDPTPSAEDIRITKQLVESGKILDVRVLDHVILGKAQAQGSPGFISLRESGLVQFCD